MNSLIGFSSVTHTFISFLLSYHSGFTFTETQFHSGHSGLGKEQYARQTVTHLADAEALGRMTVDHLLQL